MADVPTPADLAAIRARAQEWRGIAGKSGYQARGDRMAEDILALLARVAELEAEKADRHERIIAAVDQVALGSSGFAEAVREAARAAIRAAVPPVPAEAPGVES